MAAKPSRVRSARIAAVHCALLMVLTATILAACSSEEPEPAVAEPPPVDPRYATAEALAQHIDDVSAQMLQGQFGQVRGLIENVYAETPLQERVMRIADNIDPVIVLFESVLTRFPDARRNFIAGFMNQRQESFGDEVPAFVAQFKSRSERRAVIHWPDSVDERGEMHLVEFDGRW